jgi:hypothetical protein
MCQEFIGRYKKFTPMAPADFDLLINLVGPNLRKGIADSPSSYSSSKEIGRNDAILSHRRLVQLSAISLTNF